ncbi:hypothetical protein [Rhizobium sp. C4]|uniref:hypothetical protein n=1 Tax=Rhizobium sp. C4 TaxID=1349800 RepID=UPI001E2C3F66|nr:hypothetical protein [Rhizobium sp. C4]MCD2173236.1 hypothetical protein [Rhizobium sp. C4]
MASYFWEVPLAAPRRRNIVAIGVALARVAIAPMAAANRSWKRYRTERLLEGLPMDVRKDIGYRTPADIDHKRLR